VRADLRPEARLGAPQDRALAAVSGTRYVRAT
jgi:hypothetical protein